MDALVEKVSKDSTNSSFDSNFDQDIEEIEGLDEIISGGWGGDFPLDAVHIRQSFKSVRDVVYRINENRYILDPEFQRDFVWSTVKQSKLIESCLMRIPLPVFYVAEDERGRLTIVDGLQRLATFAKYLNNELKLTFPSNTQDEVKILLDGKKFEDLTPRLKDRIEDTQLIFYILDAIVSDRAKLDIFERVNSGLPLTRQQMRNAIYCGPATHWLKLVVEGVAFKKATGETLNSKTMRDREAVNRFVSFTLCGWEEYNGDMDEFLGKGLKMLSKLKECELKELQAKFEETMNYCYSVFGSNAFRKSILSRKKKTLINISLFDVMSVVFCKHLPELKNLDLKVVEKCVQNILSEEVLDRSITVGTNNKKAVALRYEVFEEKIKELIHMENSQ